MKNRILLLLLITPALSAMNLDDFNYVKLGISGYNPNVDESDFSDLPIAITRDLISRNPEPIQRAHNSHCKTITRWTLEVTPYILFLSALVAEASRTYITQEQPDQTDIIFTFSATGIVTLKSFVDLARIIHWKYNQTRNL